jgi:hypothetical protein
MLKFSLDVEMYGFPVPRTEAERIINKKLKKEREKQKKERNTKNCNTLTVGT